VSTRGYTVRTGATSRLYATNVWRRRGDRTRIQTSRLASLSPVGQLSDRLRQALWLERASSLPSLGPIPAGEERGDGRDLPRARRPSGSFMRRVFANRRARAPLPRRRHEDLAAIHPPQTTAAILACLGLPTDSPQKGWSLTFPRARVFGSRRGAL